MKISLENGKGSREILFTGPINNRRLWNRIFDAVQDELTTSELESSQDAVDQAIDRITDGRDQ